MKYFRTKQDFKVPIAGSIHDVPNGLGTFKSCYCGFVFVSSLFFITFFGNLTFTVTEFYNVPIASQTRILYVINEKNAYLLCFYPQYYNPNKKAKFCFSWEGSTNYYKNKQEFNLVAYVDEIDLVILSLFSKILLPTSDLRKCCNILNRMIHKTHRQVGRRFIIDDSY